jgi:predicted GNAT family acetyltransferase
MASDPPPGLNSGQRGRERINKETEQVTHKPSASGGEFLIGRKAVMTYRNAGEGHIIVNHTRVAKEHGGQGLAGRLYRAMVEFARRENLQVTPACSYVVHKFESNPGDRELLRKRD